MTLAQLIDKSRADARSQGLRQMIVVERHLCEREIADKAAESMEVAMLYLAGSRLPVCNLRAVETSKSMVAWEADCGDDELGQAELFGEDHSAFKFVTDFDGELVRITSPIFYARPS